MPQTLWIKQPSTELLAPANSGAVSSAAATHSINFLEGKERALEVRQLFVQHGVNLNSACNLALHIAAAVEVSDKWMTNRAKEITAQQLVRGIQMDKVASALLPAKESTKLRHYLRHLASGTLDVMSRNPSPAKNALWELETHALLRDRGIPVLLDEPDNLAKLNNLSLGLACKRSYSDENLEKVLSRGVAQIARSKALGLIAINIDDLYPPNQMRVATSYEQLAYSLSQDNISPSDSHPQVPFRRAPTRCLGGIGRYRVSPR